MEDLMQDCSMGFIKGVEKFDLNSGYELSTYLHWWILQGCTRSIENNGNTIRIPAHLYADVAKLKKFKANFMSQNGYKPILEDFYKAGFNKSKAQTIFNIIENVENPLSLDIKVGEEQDSDLSEFIPSKERSTEEIVLENEVIRNIYEAMRDVLKDKEFDVICMRFGLEDGQTYSLEEIGNIYNLSRERIRQIESEALKKLKIRMSRTKYKDMFVV